MVYQLAHLILMVLLQYINLYSVLELYKKDTEKEKSYLEHTSTHKPTSLIDKLTYIHTYIYIILYI